MQESRCVTSVLITGIHRATPFSARGWLGTGDAPRYDNYSLRLGCNHRR